MIVIFQVATSCKFRTITEIVSGGSFKFHDIPISMRRFYMGILELHIINLVSWELFKNHKSLFSGRENLVYERKSTSNETRKYDFCN